MPGARVWDSSRSCNAADRDYGNARPCKRGAEAWSDTFYARWPPRPDALPVRGAAGCRIPVQGNVVLAPAGLLNAFRYSRTGRWTRDGRARRTLDPVGDSYPTRPSPPPEAACVTREITVQDFVVDAIEEKLGRKSVSRKKGT